MKSILSTVALVATFAVSEGMIYPPLRGTVEEEIDRIKDRMIRLHQLPDRRDIFAKQDFVSRLDPNVRCEVESLLSEALKGEKDSLRKLSRNLLCGLMNSDTLIQHATYEERRRYVYEISMQVLTDSVYGRLPREGIVTALENLFCCSSEFTQQERWLLEFRDPVSVVSHQMQWDQQRGGGI